MILLLQAALAAPAELRAHTLDLPIVGGVAGYFLFSRFRDEGEHTALPSDRANLLGIDRWLVEPEPVQRAAPAALSDAFGTIGSAPIAAGLAVAFGITQGLRSNNAPEGFRQGGTFLLLSVETLGITAAVNDVVKQAVRRPRPNTYASDYAQGTNEDVLSFYSGHTASAGAWSFFAAHSFVRTTRLPGVTRALPYLGATGVTALTGYLRVRAGRHFPTDVITGGLVGAGTGLLVSELHLRSNSTIRVSQMPGGGRLDWSGTW